MTIFNANLEVTKATVQGGEIKDLEINRQNVPLASSVKLEANKAQTIDVSAYSAPVEITPTAGKDAMKKATITLSNIPVPENLAFFAWGTPGETEEENLANYYSLSATPAQGDTVHEAGYNSTEIDVDTAVIVSTGTDETGLYITIGENKYYRVSNFDFAWSE